MSSTQPPDPATAADAGEFVERMRALRLWAGQPSLRRLERLGGDVPSTTGARVKALPVSTISHVLSGKSGDRLPRMRFVERYVAACLSACGLPVERGGEYLRRWLDAWRALAGPAPAGPPESEVDEARRQLPMDIAEFTGREVELDRLLALAEAGDAHAPAVVAIEGMAGVGKTRLAVHAAHRLVNRGRFGDVQLWADLRGFDPAGPAADPAAVLDRFLRLLGVPAPRIPADVEGRSALYRDRLAGREALVLLDNVAGADQLRPLLPASTTCLVIVTSRRGLGAVDGVEPLPLDVLAPAEATALVTRLAGAERFDDDPGAAARLAELCGRLPIAISVAARRLRARTAWTPAHLLAKLDRLPRVHASFALSYQELPDGPRRLFRLLGLHPGPDVSAPSAAALAGVSVAEAEAQLETLLDEHLVQEGTPDRYHLHDLLRDYAIAMVQRDEQAAEQRQARHRLLSWYLHTADAAAQRLAPHRRRGFPLEPCSHPAQRFDSHAEALGWCEAEHANLVAAVPVAATHGEHAIAWQLPVVLLNYLYLRSHWDDWIATHTTGLASAQALGDAGGQARISNGLGVAHSDRRELDAAVAHYRRALELFTDPGGRAWTTNNLGVAMVDLGRHAAAVAEFDRALVLFREIGDRTGEAICRNNLGDAHRRLGEPERAAAHLRDALAIQEELGDRSGQRFTQHTLADLCRDRGLLEPAVAHYRRAQALSEELGDQWGTARVLDHLGSTLDTLGEAEQAKDCWRRAADLLTALGRPEADDLLARLKP
ncbi:ATP-binding protein [Labedaea rhizosphaerae]|uniref:Tetratricopeptide repeat protein n=1 Tax=Labedaea rhizosphaerae TaxID=598644 RepID=A0A4R6SB17_LABRH|nr:tetratricopeptide repeat protein [Labedaea rhizosphaerae]TDP96754.1 tetratricopeptide repeat protein [Labedaea rhizosphaerae]